MTQPAYSVARAVAPAVAEHLRLHRLALPPHAPGVPPLELLPDAQAIEALVDAAFWASLRREEGYVPKISLAFLRPVDEIEPLIFAKPLPLEPSALTHLAAAVERPGIHLGVWPDGDRLSVWGTTHAIPPFCFVVEVIAAGLLVLKHRPHHESRKFVNVAVLEGDRIKIIDERASLVPDCPALLTSLLGFDSPQSRTSAVNVLVPIAVSMRKHGRGGALLVVPAGSDAWKESIVHPMAYAVAPAFREIAHLVASDPGATRGHEWLDALGRAVEALAGLTAVDGATVITDRYELLAFGAKIRRKQAGTPVEQLLVTEPIEGGVAE